MDILSKEFAIVVYASLFLIAVSVGVIILILVYQKKQLQHLNERNLMEAVFSEEILRSQLEIQEETLRHISQEIHDNIGQVLSLAKLQLNTLPVPPMAQNREAFITTKELVSKAIMDLRNLSKSLHPDRVNELGLTENIRQELEMLQKTRLYQTNLKVTGCVYDVPIHTQTILFRMVQEAISNIIKHANATAVEIMIEYETQQFCLTIADNGIGMDTVVANGRQSGLGLRNMRHRSGIIGATFQIGKAKDGGTALRICLPANHN